MEETLQKYLSAIQLQTTNVIEVANKLKEKTELAVACADRNYHKLVTALAKVGLQIESFHFRKTGDYNKWTPGDRWIAEVKAVPNSGKFKFIQFQGYTSEGQGKNRKRLEEKAKTISEVAFGEGIDIRVNPYSLEVGNHRIGNNSTTDKRVLLNWMVT